MPEACFICLDSTEYMRNGDQFPNRLMSEQNAANMLVNAKIQMNAENTVGFLTTGGSACTVHETLTADVDRVMASLSNISIGGKVCHFSAGLLIASLALSHRTNPRSVKRIVAFVGSPLVETEKELEVLAKRLRKDDVAVDILAFGVNSNIPLLQEFVSKVSKNNNSRFLSVSDNENLTSALMNDAIFRGDNAFEGGEAGVEGGGGFPENFGVDPNMDPELAMAIRMSMEEEMQRQAAAAAAAAGNNATSENTTTTTNNNNNSGSAPANPSTEGTNPPAPTSSSTAAPVVNEEEMDEDEMLRLAIAMSLNEQGATAPATGEGTNNVENEDDEDDFLNNVKDSLKKDDDKKP